MALRMRQTLDMVCDSCLMQLNPPELTRTVLGIYVWIYAVRLCVPIYKSTYIIDYRCLQHLVLAPCISKCDLIGDGVFAEITKLKY